MWTIKEAADRAGLSPDLLRAWERRYGVVRPTRTDSGYRLYSEADIGRLRAMQRLIDDGFKPREAAEYLAKEPALADDAGVDGERRGGRGQPTVSAPQGPEGSPDALAARLIRAAGALDVAALRAYFDDLAVHGSFEVVCERFLFPAFHALGQAWAEGKISVAGEHAASAAAIRWLGAHYRAAARDTRPPQVLVALPPGAHHELGALAHAVALRRYGIDTLYLGPDLPEQDMVAAARATGARVLVLGVVVADDVAAAERVAAAVAEGLPRVTLAFGGPEAGALASRGTVLPAELSDAVVAVAALLRP